LTQLCKLWFVGFAQPGIIDLVSFYEPVHGPLATAHRSDEIAGVLRAVNAFTRNSIAGSADVPAKPEEQTESITMYITRMDNENLRTGSLCANQISSRNKEKIKPSMAGVRTFQPKRYVLASSVKFSNNLTARCNKISILRTFLLDEHRYIHDGVGARQLGCAGEEVLPSLPILITDVNTTSAGSVRWLEDCESMKGIILAGGSGSRLPR
jgi:hypothetical protein